MIWPFSLLFGATYPKPLESFFSVFGARRCPDCGSKDLEYWEDGGHDFAMECQGCKSRFGVNAAPFNTIERIGAKNSCARR